MLHMPVDQINGWRNDACTLCANGDVLQQINARSSGSCCEIIRPALYAAITWCCCHMLRMITVRLLINNEVPVPVMDYAAV